MDALLFGIPNLERILILGIILIFGILEALAGYLFGSKREAKDWSIEVGSFLVLSLLTKPFVVYLALLCADTFFPTAAGVLAAQNLIAMTILFLLVDDVLQYWYHRAAHQYEFLWKLHRPHHQAEEMGFFVSYREAALYFLFMPNIYWIGFFTFFCGAKPVLIGMILKQLVVISSHSHIKWDTFFYKFPALSPVMTVLERIFITPAFHHAHHAKTKRDGIGDPNSNFGNMFSFWDQMFGSAHYTRQFPTDYGLENDPKENFASQFLYPLVASSDSKSELSRGYEKKSTATALPIDMQLEKGQAYLWCACGMSKNQPFCDGSHHGTKFTPQRFEAKRTGKARLCNCKITKTSPFCDDSHVNWKG